MRSELKRWLKDQVRYAQERWRESDGWFALALSLALFVLLTPVLLVLITLIWIQEGRASARRELFAGDWAQFEPLLKRNGLVRGRGQCGAWCPRGLRVAWEQSERDGYRLGQVLSDTAWVLAGGPPLRGEWLLVSLNDDEPQDSCDAIVCWGSRDKCEERLACRILLDAA